MEHDGKIKIENHFEAGSMTNCNVFTGTVNGGVFPLQQKKKPRLKYKKKLLKKGQSAKRKF